MWCVFKRWMLVILKIDHFVYDPHTQQTYITMICVPIWIHVTNDSLLEYDQFNGIHFFLQ